jgi:hypothetical protein
MSGVEFKQIYEAANLHWIKFKKGFNVTLSNPDKLKNLAIKTALAAAATLVFGWLVGGKLALTFAVAVMVATGAFIYGAYREHNTWDNWTVEKIRSVKEAIPESNFKAVNWARSKIGSAVDYFADTLNAETSLAEDVEEAWLELKSATGVVCEEISDRFQSLRGWGNSRR